MRLNLLNRTTVVKSVIDANFITTLHPKQGVAKEVNADVFRYAIQGEPSNGVLIKKISLNNLFDHIPQDIRGIDFSHDPLVGTMAVPTLCGIDCALVEPPIDDFSNEVASSDDPMGEIFCDWKRLVGLQGLSRTEVELGTLDGYLLITARNATLYRGTVRVRYL